MNNTSALWKSLLTTGNNAFKNKHWEQALSWYQDASLNAYIYYRALKNDISEPGIASVLVCHFNIAETHVRLNQMEEAAKQFSDCFRFLAPIVEKHPDSEVGLRAYSHSRAEWMTFKSESGFSTEALDPPEIDLIESYLFNTQTCH